MSSVEPPTTENLPRADAAPAGRFRWARRLGVLIGLVLIVAAIIMVWRQHETVVDALSAMRRPAPEYAAMLLGGVIANVMLSGLLFSVLMSRYGRVGVLEMQALLAAATLANYLPLRPGLFGRIAYHRAVNRILARHSARTIVQAAVISVSIVAYLAAAMLIARGAEAALWVAALAPPALLPLALLRSDLRPWGLAVLIRYVEVFVWAGRYYAAFALIGLSVDATAALALACVSMIATMVPFVSNGLGLREWAIGLAAPLLTAHVLELGITAELVNRAAELVVIAVLGLIGTGFLASRPRGQRPTG